MATISGSVFYLQRIALPAGAEVRVELQDEGGRPVGEWAYATAGEQVPIPWAIGIDAAALSAAMGRLTAVATVTIDGDRRWTGASSIELASDGAVSVVDIRVGPTPTPGEDDLRPNDPPDDDELTALDVTELESLAEGWAE